VESRCWNIYKYT